MAKQSKAPVAQNEKPVVNNETAVELTPVVNNETAVELTPLEIAQAQVAEAKAKLKALKEAAKGEKKTKEAKGVMVSFTNQAGETITGKGTLYYVVRFGGKLHYKAQDAVKVLTAEEIAAIKEITPA